VPALLYFTWRAIFSASAEIRARSSGGSDQAGAYSITFWWRRCTEQSRSNR
jgi:hypothetical protein